MSGIMANGKCKDVLTPGTHATTFGANPVCAAAGLAVQKIMTDEFLDEVKEKGDYLRKGIENLNLRCFGETTGLGLMVGIGVKKGYVNKELALKLLENKLLVLTAGTGMRLMPPLTVTREEIDKALGIMKKTLS